MKLSGTSMAAPVVAGAAALMFEANPTLTPNLIKTLMMYTAQQLPNFNMFEQGAGQLNIDGAVRIGQARSYDAQQFNSAWSFVADQRCPATPNNNLIEQWRQFNVLMVQGRDSWTYLRHRHKPDYEVSKDLCQWRLNW